MRFELFPRALAAIALAAIVAACVPPPPPPVDAGGDQAAAEAIQPKVQPGAPPTVDNYRLGPGDEIDVVVYGTPDLSIAARINDSGYVNYPLIGEVYVQGLTTSEAGARIADKLEAAKIIRDPNVTVSVADYRSRRVTVVGEVPEPGEYVLSSERTLVDILAQAGWVTAEGADYIVLTRKGEDGTPGQYRLRLAALTTGKYSGMQAAPGDTIFVPKEQVFYIQGAVQDPGAYRYRDDMTVMQALAIGGGVTPRGSRDRIVLKRRNEEGVIKTYEARLETELAPGDTIFVKERLF